MMHACMYMYIIDSVELYFAVKFDDIYIILISTLT